MISIDIFGNTLSINTVYLTLGIVISLAIYMYLVFKLNPDTELFKYFVALGNFIGLCVLMIFCVVGYYIAVVCINSKQYIGLLIPIGWLYLCYVNIKKIIAIDFKIRIGKAININIDWNKWKSVFALIVLCTGFTIGTFCFFAIIFGKSTSKLQYGIFPVIIAGIIFLLVTIGLYILTYKSIIGKMQYRKRSDNSFRSLSSGDLLSPNASEEEIEKAKKEDKSEIKVFLIFWGILAALFIIAIGYCILVDRGIIRP